MVLDLIQKMVSLIKPLEVPNGPSTSTVGEKKNGYFSEPNLAIYKFLNLDFGNEIPWTRMDLLNIKEKKQKHQSLSNFSFCSGNREFIFADDRVHILDFKRGIIYQNKKLYEIWEPKGQQVYSSANEEELYFVDTGGLTVLRTTKNFVVDNSKFKTGGKVEYDFEMHIIPNSKGVGHVDADSSLHSQNKLKCILMKNINSKGSKFAEIRCVHRKLKKIKIAIHTNERKKSKNRISYNLNSQRKGKREGADLISEKDSPSPIEESTSFNHTPSNTLIPPLMEEEDNSSSKTHFKYKELVNYSLDQSGIYLKL